MKLPTFTAESSVYELTRAYVATPNHAAMKGSAVVPALAVRACRNPRPGWAIPDTLCAECADFQLQRVCIGGFCRTEWVQTSDWQWDCWSEVAE